jgi:hypothetical protein
MVLGKFIRFKANPATSRLTRIVSLPMLLPRRSAVFMASSDVSNPFTSSRILIMGTGLKKWVPTNFEALLVASAMLVIGMAEVFVAKIV